MITVMRNLTMNTVMFMTSITTMNTGRMIPQENRTAIPIVLTCTIGTAMVRTHTT